MEPLLKDSLRMKATSLLRTLFNHYGRLGSVFINVLVYMLCGLYPSVYIMPGIYTVYSSVRQMNVI